jgi:hypothetical protein
LIENAYEKLPMIYGIEEVMLKSFECCCWIVIGNEVDCMRQMMMRKEVTFAGRREDL